MKDDRYDCSRGARISGFRWLCPKDDNDFKCAGCESHGFRIQQGYRGHRMCVDTNTSGGGKLNPSYVGMCPHRVKTPFYTQGLSVADAYIKCTAFCAKLAAKPVCLPKSHKPDDIQKYEAYRYGCIRTDTMDPASQLRIAESTTAECDFDCAPDFSKLVRPFTNATCQKISPKNPSANPMACQAAVEENSGEFYDESGRQYEDVKWLPAENVFQYCPVDYGKWERDSAKIKNIDNTDKHDQIDPVQEEKPPPVQAQEQSPATKSETPEASPAPVVEQVQIQVQVPSSWSTQMAIAAAVGGVIMFVFVGLAFFFASKGKTTIAMLMAPIGLLTFALTGYTVYHFWQQHQTQ